MKVLKFSNRNEWLQARSFGIGASECATVLGVNPWETRYQLWRRKMGIDPPKEENFAMRAGHYLEDAVAQFFAHDTGAHIIQSSQADFMIVDDDKPYLRVSPDRTFWMQGEAHGNNNKCILECKTTQLEIDKDNLPMHWFCQLQMNLGVSGYKRGALAWLTMGRQFDYKMINFDAEFYAWIVDEVTKFWTENILGKQEPEMHTVEDVILKYPTQTLGKTIEATDEVLDELRQLKEVKDEMSSLDATKKQLEDSIKAAMEDAEAITKDGKPLVTWKAPKASEKFNEKRFATEQPQLYASYKESVQGARRFLIK